MHKITAALAVAFYATALGAQRPETDLPDFGVVLTRSAAIAAALNNNPQLAAPTPSVSWPRYEYLRDHATVFAAIGISAFDNFTITGEGYSPVGTIAGAGLPEKRVTARSKLCQKRWTGLVLPPNQPLNSSNTPSDQSRMRPKLAMVNAPAEVALHSSMPLGRQRMDPRWLIPPKRKPPPP